VIPRTEQVFTFGSSSTEAILRAFSTASVTEPHGRVRVRVSGKADSYASGIRIPHSSPSARSNSRSHKHCDGTSQVIRPTYSCPCLTDIRHPVDVPKSLDKFGIFFLTLPGTFYPSCRHYRTSEIKKCGSDYITYIYLKSKLKLFYYRPELKRRVLSSNIIQTKGGKNSSR
jgi:hypothetical protein